MPRILKAVNIYFIYRKKGESNCIQTPLTVLRISHRIKETYTVTRKPKWGSQQNDVTFHSHGKSAMKNGYKPVEPGKNDYEFQLAGMVKNMNAFSTNQKTGLVKNLKMRYITSIIRWVEESLQSDWSITM